MTRRHLYFALAIALLLFVFHGPLTALVRLALQNNHNSDHYSHILVVPLISAFFIYFLEKKEIFADVQFFPNGAAILAMVGLVLYWFVRGHSQLTANSYFSLRILAIVILSMGAFLLCYGAKSFRAAAFPLLFLLLAVPISEFFLSKIIFALQQGSSESVHALFTLVGVPVLREGFTFFLPGVTIEIAEECSGIRSTIAMFIVCLLAGHISLKTRWSKICLFLVALPILIVKNAIRIVSLSLIAIYHDPNVFAGPLHRYGGVPLFLLAIAVLGSIIRLFQQIEDRPRLAEKKPLHEGLSRVGT